MSDPVLHLASASPRRREILSALDLHFSYRGVDIDESQKKDESPLALVERLARSKAAAADVMALPVIGADTIVTIDDQVLGKPASRDDALEMLARLSGKEHEVLTAVAVLANAFVECAVVTTTVRFRQIGPDEAARYWQSGEAEDKAGAYAIQGLGGIFVESLRGSYSGVVGLPVFETANLLRRVGVEILPEPAGGVKHGG